MSQEMSLFEVMYNCRSMRRLKTEPVAEDLLIKLVNAGNQAASGSNMQMGRWIVIRDSAVKAEIAKLNMAAVEKYLAPDSGRAKQVAHQSDAKRKRMTDAVLWQAEHMHEMPALIIACLLFPEPVDDIARLRGGGSIWPGVQNVLLAARALGLGATPTTLGLQDRDAVKKVLNMPASMEAYCLIPVGWPKGRFGPVTRLPSEEIMRFDTWS